MDVIFIILLLTSTMYKTSSILSFYKDSSIRWNCYASLSRITSLSDYHSPLYTCIIILNFNVIFQYFTLKWHYAQLSLQTLGYTCYIFIKYIEKHAMLRQII